MLRLALQPVHPDAFAPFGTLVRPPAGLGRIEFPHAISNLRPDARTTLSASRAMPRSLPLVSSVMERHRYSSQIFIPLDVARYVVVVAPRASAGNPDMAAARAFLVPGDTGISYAADCWHHPMIILDRPGCFAVILSRSGTVEDIEILSLDEPIEIVG